MSQNVQHHQYGSAGNSTAQIAHQQSSAAYPNSTAKPVPTTAYSTFSGNSSGSAQGESDQQQTSGAGKLGDVSSKMIPAEAAIADYMGAPLLLLQPADGAAAICFTSGTTGKPKAALHSHTAFHCQALAKLMVVGYNSNDVHLHCPPMFHIGGLSSALAVLMAGGTSIFAPRFTAGTAVR